MANQSERQLGAYINGYFTKYGEPPALLNNQKASFRNKVIHKGYIPTVKEALAFGENVHSIIMEVVGRIEETEDKELGQFYRSTLPRADGYNRQTIGSTKGIALNSKEKTREMERATRVRDFSKVLADFKIPA
ncbi:hypothetical protein F0521_16230 [Ferrimonas sp. YFM]|nr:hypothetical protein F0521_16230 [Ferrimonas sp. YFM]